MDATRGAAGGYRLGAGGKLPPLLLDDEEAVAVAIGLRAATGIAGVEESSARALAKLEQVLPSRLRPTVTALATVVDRAPENNDTDAPDPEVDPAVLPRSRPRSATSSGSASTTAARPGSSSRTGCSPGHGAGISSGATPPRASGASSAPTGSTADADPPPFSPTPLPGGDYTAFAMRSIAASGWNVHARLRIAAPAEAVLDRINPTVGVVEAVSESTSVLVTGADSLETIAAYIGMLGMDFTVESPPELRHVLRTYSERYARAASA